jgi:hypothetical protein
MNAVRAASLLGLLLLAACLDIEQRVRLNEDGSGEIVVEITSGPEYAKTLMAEELLKSQTHEVSAINRLLGDRFQRVERLEFGSLSDLGLEGETLRVEVTTPRQKNDQTTRARFEHVQVQVQEVDDEIAELMPVAGLLFAGRYYDYSATMPGNITKAHPLTIQGVAIEPVVEGRTARWHIPLGLIELILEEKQLTFEIDFEVTGGSLETTEPLIIGEGCLAKPTSKCLYLEAIRTATMIADPRHRLSALAAVAYAFALAKKIQPADRTISQAISTIDDYESEGKTLDWVDILLLADAQIFLNRYDDVDDLIDRMPEDSQRTFIMLLIEGADPAWNADIVSEDEEAFENTNDRAMILPYVHYLYNSKNGSSRIRRSVAGDVNGDEGRA